MYYNATIYIHKIFEKYSFFTIVWKLKKNDTSEKWFHPIVLKAKPGGEMCHAPKYFARYSTDWNRHFPVIQSSQCRVQWEEIISEVSQWLLMKVHKHFSWKSVFFVKNNSGKEVHSRNLNS